MKKSEVVHDVIGLGSWHGAARPMARPHRHDEVELNFVNEGTITYLFSGREVIIPPGRLSVFWAGVPHQLTAIGETGKCNWVTVPLEWFLQWQFPSSFAPRIMQGEVVVEGDASRTAEDAATFKRWAEDMAADSAERRAIFLLELEARLRRLALSASPAPLQHARATRPARSFQGPGRGGAAKVETMAQFIAEHYQNSLRVADIAAAAGLHPNYAMTLFRRTFGVSLVDYATQHRVSHAQRLLLTTDAKVLDIALQSGFGSVSRFYAVFTDACKLSPKEYRTALQSRGQGPGVRKQ